MKYQPLDLSFLRSYNSAMPESTQNVARWILDNAGWSNPSNASQAAITQSGSATTSKHSTPGMQRLWDALNVGVYALANAADKGIAAHQSDNNDSVLSDIGKTVEGAAKGFGGGVAASWRGSLAGLIPGLGTDEEAQDTTNKTHFGDVLNRLYLHMPTSEAMDPANLAKVKDELSKAKVNQLGGNEPGNLLFPDGVTDKDVQEYFKITGLAGIGNDIVGDPLNFVNPLGAADKIKEATQLSKGAADLPQGLKGANDASKFDSVDRFLNGKPFTPIPGATRNEPKFLAQALNEPLTLPNGSTIPRFRNPSTDKPIDLSQLVPAAKSEANSFLNETPKGKRFVEYPKGVSKVGKEIGTTHPATGFEIPPQIQHDLARRILTHASTGDKNWLYNAANELARVAPGKSFPRTEQFLEHVNSLAKRTGKSIRAYVGPMSKDLERHISEDEASMRAASVVPATKIVNDGHIADVVLSAMQRPSERLKPKYIEVAQDVARKFNSRILGNVAPTAERIPGAMNKAIETGRNVRYSGPQQVQMWNDITHKLSRIPQGNPKKFDRVVDTLKHIEDYFISRGAIPQSAIRTDESAPLRLSEVARAIGPDILNFRQKLLTDVLKGDPEALAQFSPETIQKIEALKAGEAMAAAPGVKAGVEHGKELGDLVIKSPLSDPRKLDAMTNVIQNTKASAIAAGGGESGAYIAGRYIQQNFNLAGPLGRVYKSSRLDTMAFLAGAAEVDSRFAKIDPKQIKSINNALRQEIQSPPVRNLGEKIGPAARAVDWLGARFNAAYGNADMRPIFLAQQASALSTAARRSQYINSLGREFPVADKELWSDAFKSAQKNAPPIGDDRVDGLASEIQNVMESLFGGSGIREGAIAEATVVARSRLLMADLNRNLKKFGLGAFKFTNKQVKDAAGITQDYSRGADWLKSWESWTVQDPYKFMHQIQGAVESTVREKLMFDEIASRFGSFNKLNHPTNPVKFGVNNPRLKGVYFTEEGARQIQQLLKNMKEFEQPSSKGLQQIQHVISKMKAALTIYWPAHHVNNLIGDVFMNWYAGVNSAHAYNIALKVMRSQRGQYDDIAELGMLTSPNALRDAIEASQSAGANPIAEGNRIAFTMKNGEKVSNDMVATAAHKMGIMPVGRFIEDVADDASNVLDRIGLPGRFRGTGQRFAHGISETRDHFPRYAQFIDSLMKSNKSFEEGIIDAANDVRKWHPDGLDLTKFERNTMKTILPFYSWMRKAVPLIIEATLTSPGKIKAYPELINAIQIANGIQPEHSIDEPFPTDQLFADWMREKGIGPILGGPGNYTIVNPSVPGTDVWSSIFAPKQSIEGYLNPMIKVPLETIQSREMSGQQIGGPGNESWLNYYAKQTPVVSNIGRTTGTFGISDTAKSQGFGIQNLLNLLGARMTNTGPYQKSAQFNLRDYLRSQNG